MINIEKISKDTPYRRFKKFYKAAIENNQLTVDAMAISSIDKDKNEADSRYVNLKYVDNKDFIFFSNYQSKKARQFEISNKVSLLLYWNTINLQIRIKGIITKVPESFSDKHFALRSKEKNALAISSRQSNLTQSYNDVIKNYNRILDSMDDNAARPLYWGGYKVSPYYFEFWEGHDSRINKRIAYNFNKSQWNEFYLQP